MSLTLVFFLIMIVSVAVLIVSGFAAFAAEEATHPELYGRIASAFFVTAFISIITFLTLALFSFSHNQDVSHQRCLQNGGVVYAQGNSSKCLKTQPVELQPL